MKIEDCKILPEFFGVELGSPLWVEGKYFRVFEAFLISDDYDSSVDGRVLVGCLTGQLEWSREPPISNKLEGLLRKLAARMPAWSRISWGDDIGLVFIYDGPFRSYSFRPMNLELEEYEILRAYIIEQQSDINLDDYREDDNED